MVEWKQGDAVRIIERNPTQADTRSGLYFGHYRGLTGTIFKLYGQGESAQAAIDIDIETLPEEAANRHQETLEQMRASITGGAKRTRTEPDMRLRYVVLVAVSDLKCYVPYSPL